MKDLSNFISESALKNWNMSDEWLIAVFAAFQYLDSSVLFDDLAKVTGIKRETFEDIAESFYSVVKDNVLPSDKWNELGSAHKLSKKIAEIAK